MKIIQLKRGAGKTRRVVKKFAEDPKGVLLVPTNAQKVAIERALYPEPDTRFLHDWLSAPSGYRTNNRIITLQQLINPNRNPFAGFGEVNVYIDNLDVILPTLLNLSSAATLHTATINDEVRVKTAEGHQIVEVGGKWSYYWDEPGDPLRVGDTVVLPPSAGKHRWRAKVTAIGTKYEGPLKGVLAKV